MFSNFTFAFVGGTMCPTAGVATAVGPEDIICNLYLKPSVPTYGSVRQRHPLPSTPLQMQKKRQNPCVPGETWG